MNEKSPAFQFYPLDFLGDANVKLMSIAERGAYITLLCHCWLEKGLPNDLLKLSCLADCDSEHDINFVTDIWPRIAHCFYKDAHERWQHKRLDRERDKQIDRSKYMSEIANKRWGNKLRNKRTVCGAAKRTVCSSSSSSSSFSSSSSSSSSKLKEKNSSALTDEEFFVSLKNNPAYQSINIPNELSKMDAWISVNPGKKKTRRFIVNWLNRIDKEIKPSVNGLTSKTQKKLQELKEL